MLSDTVVESVVVYLKKIGRQRHWRECADDVIARMVVDEYLGADLDELLALTDETAPLDVDALVAAMNHFNAWYVVAWSRRQNAKGITPSSATLSAELAHCRPFFLKHHLTAKPWAVSGTGVARMQVSRLRGCFRGRIGKLLPQDFIPLDVMQEKAPIRIVLWFDQIS